MNHRLLILTGLGLFGAALPAQDSARAPTPGVLRGRVLADANGVPLVGAEVELPALHRTVRTDSAGRYELPGLPAGKLVVHVRAIGFRPDSEVAEIRDRRAIALTFRLALDAGAPAPAPAAVQPLPAAVTKAPEPRGKLSEFELHRARGIGTFLDRAQIAKWDSKNTSELLATVGGMQVKHGGMKAWASTGRVPETQCQFCRPVQSPDEVLTKSDFSAGARPACYMDVYLDGIRVYFMQSPPQPLFDVNSLAPSSIEAIEVYTSPAQTPAEFDKKSTGCGVIAIWTRNGASGH